MFHVERPTESVSRGTRRPGRVITIVNQKGGVGKTTTAVNLSACLACAERLTLLVDLDPQGNATSGLGLRKEGLSPTIYHVLLGRETIDRALHSTAFPTLFIAPADIDLVGAEVELVGMPSRETQLRGALEPTRRGFDYVIIDCPPSLGLLTINALTASDSVLIPLQCEFYALEGLAHLVRTIKLVRERLNPVLQIEGILLTMFDGRTSLAGQVRDDVHRFFEGQIFETIIPRNIRLTEAPSHGQPIVLYDLRSSGATAYLELTREVLSHE
jgi:chromosome partitioning protein